jgi:nucleotide-binding universal stress UspA family protein
MNSSEECRVADHPCFGASADSLVMSKNNIIKKGVFVMKKTLFMLLVVIGAMLFVDNNSAPFFLPFVFAHCDTLDGPVVKTAKAALEKGDVTPILKWIKKENEAEIKDLFKRTLIVRSKGKEAQELVDMYFFETLVRLHRAGEGAPYTGLKPAGVVEHAVVEADKALESGSVEILVKLVTEAASKGIRERFNKAKEAKKHADHNVEAGREFVDAYVQFTHYVERLHIDSTAEGAHHHGAPQAEPEELHKH